MDPDLRKQMLIEYFAELGYISRACIENIKKRFVIVERPARAPLALKGQMAFKCWFLLEGLVKSYYESRLNYQKIVAFYGEHEFVLDSPLFFLEKAFPYRIECLEKCILAEISHSEMFLLAKEFPELNRIYLKIAALSNAKASIRTRILSKKEGEDRYHIFCREHTYHSRISRHDIASYLNISKSRLDHIIAEARKG